MAVTLTSHEIGGILVQFNTVKNSSKLIDRNLSKLNGMLGVVFAAVE